MKIAESADHIAYPLPDPPGCILSGRFARVDIVKWCMQVSSSDTLAGVRVQEWLGELAYRRGLFDQGLTQVGPLSTPSTDDWLRWAARAAPLPEPWATLCRVTEPHPRKRRA